LVGGAGVVAVGAGGAALVEYDVVPGRPALHRLLHLDGPRGHIPDVATGPVVTGRLTSSHVPSEPEFRIAYPPGVDEGARLPVVVVLHYAGSSAERAFRILGLPEFLADSGARMALAAVDGGRSYWQAHDDGDWGALVLEDLLPMLADRGLDVDAPAWLGWSMGGYGVLRLAASRQRDGLPNGPVVGVSPALWPAYDETTPTAFLDEAAYDDAMALLADQPLPDCRLDCGTGDPFYRNVLDFTDGSAVETHFEAGGHDPGYWTRELPGQLAWLAARVPGALPGAAQ
jgi:S-formylglutathione hydrolase FrmB